jgi:hypothetical protein
MRISSPMRFVIGMRISMPKPPFQFVSSAKPLTPVAFCRGVNDYEASMWIGAYQDLVEMTEHLCEVNGTRKV